MPVRIDQFHNGSASGDGITNAMFFVQRLLRAAGHLSEIFCVHVDPALEGRIRPASAYIDDPGHVLLVHYSLGAPSDAWIGSLAAARVLVYHNITPADHFPPGSELHRLALGGRVQLERWARDEIFRGVIADSPFNRQDLLGMGFREVRTIELLVDLDRLRGQAAEPISALPEPARKLLLFVGRIAPHKNQLDLVRALALLRGRQDCPDLALVGASGDGDYHQALVGEIEAGGLGGRVHLLGKRSDAEVIGLYRRADAYVSASRHEGFGMPLVEAMAFDLPVIAYGAGAVADTLGRGGLVLQRQDPRLLAAAALSVLGDPVLRGRVIEGQRESLRRYEPAVLAEAFAAYLQEIGFPVRLGASHRATPIPAWRLEGPLDGAYSLALVNRELARGLARNGVSLQLVSCDGGRAYAPDPSFLRANSDIARLLEAEDGTRPEVLLRNQFPPEAAGMRGVVNVLANYAWEESGFPVAWVEAFNRSLDLVTVTSRFVAKTLRDNGVAVPIAVVGNGVDGAPFDLADVVEREVRQFLHVSSAFPRKGIDVLLSAWAEAFDRDSGVTLTLKTFPNIHHDIEAELARFRQAHPAHAPIRLVNAEIGEAELDALYAAADVVVCPSRGEGFGLPLAEALLRGRPVVATAFGGHTEFCTPETAWLCDYSFAYARTHLPTYDSVWAEPDVDSLAAALLELRASTTAERARRVAAGRALLQSRFTWEAAASRTIAAVERVRASYRQPEPDPPRVGLVTSWNVRCGIASYAGFLAANFRRIRPLVFADKVGETLSPDAADVRRCWTQGLTAPLDELRRALLLAQLDAVVIQFNFGFFGLDRLAGLIEELVDAGVHVFIVLHATHLLRRPDVVVRIPDVSATLAKATRLFVHSVHDLNRLKSAGLVENVALFPMGVPDVPVARPARTGTTTVATFGFLLPHKGLREAIAAMAILRDEGRDVRLTMYNALYPGPESEQELARCQALVRRLALADRVTICTDYFDEAAVIERLAAVDLIVYPYQATYESSSAAVRLGLVSMTPVAVTPSPIFADVERVCHRLPGGGAAEIAAGIAHILGAPEDKEFQARQRAWVQAHSWTVLSARLENIILGEIGAGRPVARLEPEPRPAGRPGEFAAAVP